MLKDWIDIFKGGWQMDSNGKEHDGDRLINSALDSFSAEHTPPVVIGHPKDTDKAMAWVSSIREKFIDGKRFLQAKFKDINPDFAKAVKAGSYKKRSASFYPDGSLRHVGFLGAMPPAVKGLADIKFKEGERITFDFNHQKRGEKMKFAGFKELFDFMKKAEVESDDVSTLQTSITENQGRQFSEADIAALQKAAKDEGAAEAKKQAAASFAEAETVRVRKVRLDGIKTFVDTEIKAGHIPPAWKDIGIVAFMESLIPDSTEIEFSEGKKQIPLEWFKGFLTNFNADNLFIEFATKETAKDGKETADEVTGAEIAAKVNMKEEV